MLNRPINVLLVDDHLMVRNGIRLMLSEHADICVAAEAANAQMAMQLLRTMKFDVALIDIGLPDSNGMELLRKIRSEHPQLAVLMLSSYLEDIYALRALKMGAAGYLTKDISASALATALRKVATGGKYASPTTIDLLAEAFSGASRRDHTGLSNRELEVLKRIAAGDSLVKIADALCLSPHTITTYRRRIFEKMGWSTNAELTRYALENRLLI